MADLLIDIGNSISKFTVSENGKLGDIFRYEGDNLLDFLDRGLDGNIKTAVVSSVTEINPFLIEYLKLKCERVVILDSKTDSPVRTMYETPETLGPDRIAAAIGAYSLMKGSKCLIFDFGTALTVDIVTENGEFKGGNISLGLRTRYEAINHYTKKLPLLTPPEELPERSRMLGKTTKTAIEYGVISSMLFEIEGYMEKYPDHKVIFTGGDAFYFADKMKKPIFVICNLVLIGLSYLAQYKSDEKDI